MIRYWRRSTVKEADASHLRSDSKNRIAYKPWLQDTYNYSSKELTQPDDSYISMGFRKHEHKQRSRRMMDKQLQKYFEKAEQDLLNKQKSDKWRNLKSTFDSYMNLTAAERRRTNVANMRGYQLDKGRKLLYSFEDNSVYDIEISEKFLNKISVKTLNHKFSDIEKRSVFDNPFQYPPVSPYRIVWPTAGVTGVGELALANIEKSMNEISTTASAFTQTMPGMMNDFTSTLDKTAAMFQQNIQQNMQQNAAIQTNIGDAKGNAGTEGGVTFGNSAAQSASL